MSPDPAIARRSLPTWQKPIGILQFPLMPKGAWFLDFVFSFGISPTTRWIVISTKLVSESSMWFVIRGVLIFASMNLRHWFLLKLWFPIFFIFTRIPGEMIPNLTLTIIFLYNLGWFKPPTSDLGGCWLLQTAWFNATTWTWLTLSATGKVTPFRPPMSFRTLQPPVPWMRVPRCGAFRGRNFVF